MDQLSCEEDARNIADMYGIRRHMCHNCRDTNGKGCLYVCGSSIHKARDYNNNEKKY